MTVPGRRTASSSSQAEFTASYPQRYWIENRQLVGADAGFDNSPYNFPDAATLPDWVEHFAYQTNGVELWYNWDAFADNNVGGHPGVGLILPIDVQAEPLLWDDDANPATTEFVRNRIQPYDAALSLEDTPVITLNRPHAEGGDTETTWGGLPAVSLFDDVNGVYWYEERAEPRRDPRADRYDGRAHLDERALRRHLERDDLDQRGRLRRRRIRRTASRRRRRRRCRRLVATTRRRWPGSASAHSSPVVCSSLSRRAASARTRSPQHHRTATSPRARPRTRGRALGLSATPFMHLINPKMIR